MVLTIDLGSGFFAKFMLTFDLGKTTLISAERWGT